MKILKTLLQQCSKVLIFNLLIKFLAFLFFFYGFAAYAAKSDAKLNQISFERNDLLKISLSKGTDIKVFALDSPSRLVVDVKSSYLSKSTQKKLSAANVKDMRSSKTLGKQRLVFDLKKSVEVGKVKKLKYKNGKPSVFEINLSEVGAQVTSGQANKRQVIDFGDFVNQKVDQLNKKQKIYSLSQDVSKKSSNISSEVIRKKKYKPVIVIDAGHGGRDPGAIGHYARTKEKNITLSYSKALYKSLKKTGRYRVYMTRKKDRFISLRKRVEFARRKKADLFLSIHANAARNKKVSGFSIYTLSERSSDKEAAMLARKENRADIISGVNFSGSSQDVVKMMIDMSQRESMNSSARFAKFSVKSMKNSRVNILKNAHRSAGFVVLTAPDMISVLVELGYLTNYREEKKLNSYRYKKKLVASLTNAIDQYFAKYNTNYQK